MTIGYKAGDKVYIIENATSIREATVIRTGSGFYTLRFSDGGGTRLRESRLFRSRTDAEESVCRLHKANKRIADANDSNRNADDISWLG